MLITIWSDWKLAAPTTFVLMCDLPMAAAITGLVQTTVSANIQFIVLAAQEKVETKRGQNHDMDECSIYYTTSHIEFIGAPGRIRTCGTRIRKLLRDENSEKQRTKGEHKG